MIHEIGKTEIQFSDLQEENTVKEFDPKQFEQAFANVGKALAEWSDKMRAQTIFGQAMDDIEAVPNRLAFIETDLVWKIQEAAADLALMADMELKDRGV